MPDLSSPFDLHDDDRPVGHIVNRRQAKNENDGIYRQTDGQTLVELTSTDEGYAAAFDMAMYVD